MQPVDSKLYSANAPSFRSSGIGLIEQRSYEAAARRRALTPRGNFISRLESTTAAERLLALLLAAIVVTASPALIATVRTTVSFSLQILLQAGHAGFIAFQIFGR